jgi:hypothetical protein
MKSSTSGRTGPGRKGIFTLACLLAASTVTLGSGPAAQYAAADSDSQAPISLDGCVLTSSEGITYLKFGNTTRTYPGSTRLNLDHVPGIEAATTIEVGAGTTVMTFNDIDCGRELVETSGDATGGPDNGDAPETEFEQGGDEPDREGEPDSDGEGDGNGDVLDGGGEVPKPGASLDEIRERCEKLNFDLAYATLVFEPEQRMVLEVASEVAANLILDQDELGETDTEGDEGTRLIVSCTVEARLRGGEFSIDDTDWKKESLISATSSASWSWFVTPNRLGEHQLTLEVRPVLLIDQEISTTVHERRTVTVVDSSFGARLLRWLGLTTDVLNTFERLLLAISAVLVAAAGVLASMWWRKREVPQRQGR